MIATDGVVGARSLQGRARRVIGAALVGAALLGFVCEAAMPYRKGKNPKYHHKKKRATAAAPAGPVEPSLPPPLLADGRWDPKVKGRLEDFIRAQGKDNPDYNPSDLPVAVFSLNGVAIVNDLGEAVLQRVALRLDFKMDDKFWPLVPPAFGRARLKADYEQLLASPVSIWPSQPAYRRLRKGFLAAYRGLCDKYGRRDCRGWVAQLFQGFKQPDAVTYAGEAIQTAFLAPVGPGLISESDDDPSPASIRTGLRKVPEMAELIEVLGNEGFEVWIVSEDPQFAVGQMAKELGLDPERGIGIEVEVSSDTKVMSGVLKHPLPFGSGKVEAVSAIIGKSPAFSVARHAEDLDFLGYGRGLRLLLDGGDPSLRKAAAERGWLIQPAFPQR